jgi:hypothetical protein
LNLEFAPSQSPNKISTMSRLYSDIASSVKAKPKEIMKSIQKEEKRVVSYSEYPSMKRVYTVSEEDFQTWLDIPIWVSGNDKGTRREYIPVFADALTDWMKLIGYKMDGRWGKGHRVVAKWLYAIHVLEIARCNFSAPLAYPEIIHRNWEEDYDEFSLRINYHSVDSFLEKWVTIEDFDNETRWGARVYEELETLLWHHIDLDASRIGIRLAEKLMVSDSDSESGGSRRGGRSRKIDDVYIQEAREGLHGGRGFKV